MNPLQLLRHCTIVSLLLFCSTVHAQVPIAADTIVFRNGQHLAVRIDEFGLDEIKYHAMDDGIRISVAKEDVSRVRLHTGRVVNVTNDLMSVGYSPRAMAKRNVVKMEVLSFALDHLTMAYERVLKPWMNLEVRASYIGTGNGRMKDQSTGMMVAGGVKFISRPDHLMRGMRLGHPLHGRYVKPEILFNTFTVDSRRTSTINWGSGQSLVHEEQTQVHCTNVALNVVFGKQRLLGDGLTLDTWVGIGYGYQSVSADDPALDAERTFCYNHTLLGKELPIALSAGMSLGVAF